MNEYKNKRALVFGYAKSGRAASQLLLKLGASVTITEMKAPELLEGLDELIAGGAVFVPQSEDVFEEDYDFVVKNPGIPYNSPFIKRLKERGIPVITEIELAYNAAKKQHYAAITGTNGKTTTATLCYEMAKAAYGSLACLSGNIGTPLCETVLKENLLENEGRYIILEISNFQLLNIDKFRPETAVILNLTPDHLDFMASLDEYYESKTRVYRNMRGDDLFLLNADDAVLAEYTGRYPVNCGIKTFSTEKDGCDYCIENGYIAENGNPLLPLSDIKIVGRHNVQNVIAACAIARSFGISAEIIANTVASFNGVHHRIEFVREKDGVKYYNDSKGTNTDATITALRAFSEPVILLVGGFEKNLPMDELKTHLGGVKKLIGFGACGARLVRDLGGGTVVNNLQEAVSEAVNAAKPGDIVLLSPTTSSFDQYKSYDERGDHFKNLVNEL